MKIDVICSSADHPVNACLEAWRDRRAAEHDIGLLQRVKDARGGDILFLVSCTEIVDKSVRDRYRHALVLHASDLPEGRGWSPHVWAILEGARDITVSLLDAEDRVDTGAIWAKRRFRVPADALYDEINAGLFAKELALMDEALAMAMRGEGPVPQRADGVSYCPRRRPEDSELDPTRALSELFDAIRVADPDRYPAFFRLRGHVYEIRLRKVGKDDRDQD